VLTLLLAAEFFMAPVNLWTGRTMGNFTAFTGLPPSVAMRVFAPIKLVAAVLLVVGLAERAASVAGALVIVVVSVAYLILLAVPGRRSGAGIAAFGLTLVAAVGIVALQLAR
jgi:uncharacterized membrane protein YphA (DoxX/SURF4 family)